jgi:signal transduction histidine kinase
MTEKITDTVADENLAHGFVRTRLSLIEYAASHSLDELLTHSLDVVEAQVDSLVSFYHSVDPDRKTVTLQQWSTRTLEEFCRAEGKGRHYAIEQAGVWVDSFHQKKAVIHNDYASLPHKKGLPDRHSPIVRELVVPVIRDEKVVALLGVGNKPVNYTQQDIEIVSYLADVTWEIVKQKEADENLRQTTLKLQERVKELSCLYSISQLVEEDNLNLEEICRKTVALIPPTWLYPEITCARIKLDDKTYQTERFRKTEWMQSQPVKVNRKTIGAIEVYLLEKKPERDEGPFLGEERSLLKAIAERLGHIIENGQAKEALQRAHDELQLRVEERTSELAEQNKQLLSEIRERKRAEEELLRSSEKIKLFALSVAHDLKNPAISTYGLARILNEKCSARLTDRGKRICKQIQRSSEDIASLVEKINIYISAKENPLQIEKISSREILHILEDDFASQLRVRSIQVVISDDIPRHIFADRLSIIRIFRNLIENSLKYGGDKLSRIVIDYNVTEDFHIFRFTDNGLGIKSGSNNIFNWFERDDAPSHIKGTGMGLAIVKEIATLHGGKVWQETAEPQGASICVSLSRHLTARAKSPDRKTAKD